MDRIFQCLLSPSAPEEAVAAAAATWLVVGHADASTVILFTSASQYVRAVGGRDTLGNVDVEVDSGNESIAALFSPEIIVGELSSTDGIESCVWPDRLSACFISPGSHSTTYPAGDIASRILDNASSQQTIRPGAAHMAAMAEFAAGAGHEINNPLGSIIGQSQLLLKQEQQTDRRQALATIGSQAWRIRDMIGDCMLFGRPPEPDLQSVEMNELVRQAAAGAVESLTQSPQCLQFELPSVPLAAQVDSTQISTLVAHLVRNGVEAALNHDSQPHITVSLMSEANAVILRVRDRGPGLVDEQLRHHLFDPFFSGRQAGRGIGFGLPVCWQIAQNHDGLILCETPEHGETQFVVALPKSR